MAEFDEGTAPDLSKIVVQLNLERLGELIARVADQLCQYRGIEAFDVESGEARHLAIDGWRYVCHMADRAEFEQSVQADLAQLADAPSGLDDKIVGPS